MDNVHNSPENGLILIMRTLNSINDNYNENIRTYNSNISSLITILNNMVDNIDLNSTRTRRGWSPSTFTEPLNRNVGSRSFTQRPLPNINRIPTLPTRNINRIPTLPTRNIQIPQPNIFSNDTESLFGSLSHNMFNISSPVMVPDRIRNIYANNNNRRLSHNFNRSININNNLSDGDTINDNNVSHSDAIIQEIINMITGFQDNNFQNVPVFPSLTQIQSATTCYNYTEEEYNNNQNEVCPITLEELQINDEICVINHCNHIFKKEALFRWFNNNVRCPVCRFDIRDDISGDNTIEQPITDVSNNSLFTDTLSSVLSNNIRSIFEIELEVPISIHNDDISGNIDYSNLDSSNNLLITNALDALLQMQTDLSNNNSLLEHSDLSALNPNIRYI